MAEKEYIERKKVISHLDCIANDQQAADDYKKAAWAFSIFVDRLPAADVAPVVHGRWITEYEGLPFCSVCDYDGYGYILSPYCPNCGTKMDIGGNDNEV